MEKEQHIVFRKAIMGDLELLNRWNEEPHVLAASDEPWDFETDLAQDPEWRDQFIVEWKGRPIGFVQIIDPHLEETQYWGAVGPNKRAIDIWIGEGDCLNQGLGTIMMKNAIQHCFESETVESILIDPLVSNIEAHRFYERLGFVFLREQLFDGSLCRVYQLLRDNFE